MKEHESKMEFGQVWNAIKDYQITESWSLQKNSVIPCGTRIVTLRPPVFGKKYFGILLLNSKGLDERLSPDLLKMEKEKEGFGIAVEIKKFRECFVLDENQSILFDNENTAIFWREILEHMPPAKAKDPRARTI